MTPGEIKAKVQGAYVKALENRSMQRYRGSSSQELFRDLKLYGRDAGTDFVETNLAWIVQEAVETAECKGASLELTPYGFGRSALEGMAQALRDLTGLKVDSSGKTIRLIWAETTPGLV